MRHCYCCGYHPLRVLALLLLDIDPTAARAELVFSFMGMNKTKVRNRMSVDTNGALTKIQVCYKGKNPKDLRNKRRDEGDASQLVGRTTLPELTTAQPTTSTPTGAAPPSTEQPESSNAAAEADDGADEDGTAEYLHEMLESFNEEEMAALQDNGLPTSFTALLTQHWTGYDVESDLFRTLDDPPLMANSAVAAESLIREPTTSQFEADDLVQRFLAANRAPGS